MDRIINLGILATGKIADKVTNTLVQLKYLKVYAVASRSIDKAKSFAEKYNISKYYGSYEEMMKDPNVDLVYITTPHSEHKNNIKLCAEYGKNIICEKPFAINEKEAEEAIETCKNKNVLVAEAIWCRYAPMAKTIKDFINTGKLGKIHYITANLGYNVYHRERLHNPQLGGGALLDVGVYAIHFVDHILGLEPTDIRVHADLDSNKIDRQENITLTYPGNIEAALYSSIVNETDHFGFIYGDNGYAVIDNINLYTRLRFYNNQNQAVPEIDITAPSYISGYEYEFEACCKAVNKGLIEVEESKHSQTLRIMKIMDSIRKEMGVKYPFE